MGIPLYRERTAPAPSPQAKLPVVCPYASPNHGNTRHHHHHHLSGLAQRAHPIVFDAAPPQVEGQSPEQAAIATRVWRNVPRQHISRDRPDRSTTESHERSTAASGRYTQRLVRSAPGSREYEDEIRAAELVDIYFQELHRYSRTRQEEVGGQS